MVSKKLYVMNRFGFYSVRQLPEDKILFNATNLQDANGVFKKFMKRNIKNSDISFHPR